MQRRVVIAGGGVAALEATLALRALVEERLEIDLIAPEPHFWYRPLSVAEPFELGETHRFELASLASRAGGTFTLGALEGVDVSGREAWTTSGTFSYDALLVAVGAVPVDAVPGALTFRGPADTDRVRAVLDELAAGEVRRVAFVDPLGAAWSLPLYELALMTAVWIGARGIQGVELTLVTPDAVPLEVFGRAGSDAVRALLDEHGIDVVLASTATEFADERLRLAAGGSVGADRAIALPRLRGPRLDGLPQTPNGFLPTDAHGRVKGLGDVYAAGDIANFRIKQGGLAAQLADAAAEAIAARLDGDLRPEPFRPVLRGVLLTGRSPRFLRRELVEDGGDAAGLEPLWWPPAKIAGRHLAPFLAQTAGVGAPAGEAGTPQGISIEVDVAEGEASRIPASPSGDRHGAGAGARVGELALAELPGVAPDDRIGEAAARMGAAGTGAVAVVEAGRLVGVLTSHDLLRALAALADAGTARVREWMTAEPVAVPATAGIAQAVAAMDEHGLHRLPVVEGERPIGMLGYRQAVEALRGRGIGLGF